MRSNALTRSGSGTHGSYVRYNDRGCRPARKEGLLDSHRTSPLRRASRGGGRARRPRTHARRGSRRPHRHDDDSGDALDDAGAHPWRSARRRVNESHDGSRLVDHDHGAPARRDRSPGHEAGREARGDDHARCHGAADAGARDRFTGRLAALLEQRALLPRQLHVEWALVHPLGRRHSRATGPGRPGESARAGCGTARRGSAQGQARCGEGASRRATGEAEAGGRSPPPCGGGGLHATCPSRRSRGARGERRPPPAAHRPDDARRRVAALRRRGRRARRRVRPRQARRDLRHPARRRRCRPQPRARDAGDAPLHVRLRRRRRPRRSRIGAYWWWCGGAVPQGVLPPLVAAPTAPCPGC